jgi:hypothetical protein
MKKARRRVLVRLAQRQSRFNEGSASEAEKYAAVLTDRVWLAKDRGVVLLEKLKGEMGLAGDGRGADL